MQWCPPTTRAARRRRRRGAGRRRRRPSESFPPTPPHAQLSPLLPRPRALLPRRPPMESHRRSWFVVLAVACVVAALATTPSVASARTDAGDGVPGGACDVAVVGAGIGGLYAAWRLATAGGKAGVRPHRVCVFEATARTGGRILTLRGKEALPKGYDGYTVDMGALRVGLRRTGSWFLGSGQRERGRNERGTIVF